jgi:LEA14-like dessication related protein
MRKLFGARGVLLGALAIGVAGCASLGMLGGFKQPIVNFRNVEIKGLGLTGGSMDIVLSVYNPNSYKLEGTRLTYKLLAGDSVSVGQGALDSRFTVQDNDSTIVRIPMDFTYTGIGAVGRQILNTGTVNYRVLGDITVNGPGGTNYTVPYDRTGRFTALGGTTQTR